MSIATLLVVSALMAANTASTREVTCQIANAGAGTVELQVAAFKSIDDAGLALAKRTAQRLLARVCVGVSWTDSTTPSACSNGSERGPVRVQLLPMASNIDASRTGLVARDARTHDPVIVVYMARIRAIVLDAQRNMEGRAHPLLANLEVGHVLGLVIAHELGHVLGLAHAPRGVMKASPDLADLVALRSAGLVFEDADAALMQQRANNFRRGCGTHSHTVGRW